MKTLKAPGSSPLVSGALLAIALAGCGAQSPLAPASLAKTDARATRVAPSAGGAFSGAYSGTYLFDCQIGLSRFTFIGNGSASFIHASNEHGELREGNGGCPNDTWSGTATLESRRHPSNTISVALKTRPGSGFPCSLGCSFSVTGGTGKFTNAAGSGTLTITKLGSRAYSDAWSGTITY